jgi:hypothetical protein
MADQHDALVKAPKRRAALPAPNDDLSSEMDVTLERQAGETVRCVRVFADSYRCNWWASQDRIAPLGAASDYLAASQRHVRMSKFLRVTKGKDGLVIEDLTRQQ